MPTPLEDHGGSIPDQFHTCWLNDKKSKLIVFVKLESPDFDIRSFWSSLLLNNIGLVLFYSQEDLTNSFPFFHPLIKFIKTESVENIAHALLKDGDEKAHVWALDVSSNDLLHPNLWKIIETASIRKSISFVNEEDQEQLRLWSITKDGIQRECIVIRSTILYKNYCSDKERIIESVKHQLSNHCARILQTIKIDVDSCFTPLCSLAIEYGTDKSPYNLFTHRHPYTPVYDMFLRTYKQKKNLKLGEFGVLNGSSIRMWKDYFPHVSVDAYDIDQNLLNNVSNIQNVSTFQVNSGDAKALRDTLSKACSNGHLYDILLEDASHRLEHQLIFLREALQYVAPGGVLIIEDIFREISPSRFEEVLREQSEKVSHAVLIDPEHSYCFSPGWENDRILMVFRR